MNQRAFNLTAGLIFLVTGILHVLRVIFGWTAAIRGWDVSEWVSWAFVMAGFSAYEGFRLRKMARR
jgi:hypothetical protein